MKLLRKNTRSQPQHSRTNPVSLKDVPSSLSVRATSCSPLTDHKRPGRPRVHPGDRPCAAVHLKLAADDYDAAARSRAVAASRSRISFGAASGASSRTPIADRHERARETDVRRESRRRLGVRIGGP